LSYNGWADHTPEDMACVILAWFARGGAHHNYNYVQGIEEITCEGE